MPPGVSSLAIHRCHLRGRLRLLALGLTALAVGGARVAHAQAITGFAVDRFEPAGAGSEWMSAESLDFTGHVRPIFALVSDWAWKPVVLYDPAGAEVKALVRQQLVAHADAALMLWNCVRIDLNLPVALAQSGSDTQIRERTYAAPRGGALGDLRLGIDVRVFGHVHDPLTIAVGAQLFIPTGQTQAFSSDGGLRGWPRVLAAGERGRFVWAAGLGLHIRPRNKCGCDLSPGTEVTGSAAAGWRLSPRLLVGPEIYGSVAASSGGPFSRAAPPVEALLGAHYVVAPRWTLSGGLAPGLTDGAGTPVFRAVVGVQYSGESLVRPQGPPPPAWPAAASGP